ncbi:MAG: NUDIX hydrolase [Dehalococcoidia bacterium]
MAKGSSPEMRTERAVSAGGVVYRKGEKGLEVVLCGRDADGVWGLPKGMPDPGESLEEAAIREVSEETGLQVKLVDKIGIVEYWFAHPQEGVRYHKFVHHFLLVPNGGSTDDHDWEYDRVEWFPIEEALKTLSYSTEVAIVREAQALIEEAA